MESLRIGYGGNLQSKPHEQLNCQGENHWRVDLSGEWRFPKWHIGSFHYLTLPITEVGEYVTRVDCSSALPDFPFLVFACFSITGHLSLLIDSKIDPLRGRSTPPYPTRPAYLRQG